MHSVNLSVGQWETQSFKELPSSPPVHESDPEQSAVQVSAQALNASGSSDGHILRQADSEPPGQPLGPGLGGGVGQGLEHVFTQASKVAVGQPFIHWAKSSSVQPHVQPAGLGVGGGTGVGTAGVGVGGGGTGVGGGLHLFGSGPCFTVPVICKLEISK